MIDRLRQILAGQGYDLDAGELLDVLWLARAVREGELRSALPAPESARDTGSDAPSDEPGQGDPAGAPEDASGGGPGEAGGTDGPREDGAFGDLPGGVPATVLPSQRSLYAMGSEGGSALSRRARPARAPGRRALARPQHLSRALRPLRRFEPHPHRRVTDVEATVRLAAETALFDVVSRPDQERRWSAVLLVDEAPSMQVWSQLAGELRSVLDRGGIFRSVRVCAFDPLDMAVLGRLPWAAGPTLTFVLTDGTSPGWRTPDAARAVRRWGRYGPVAVLHPLPRRLWRGTALDAQPRLLTSPVEFAGPDRTGVLDPLTGEPDPEAEEPGTVALPVVPLTPGGLGQWAALLTRPGVPHLIDTVLLGEEPEQDPPRPAGSAEDLVAHFRGAFSPESYRLAVRLSAINPLTVPLMQLVRAATMSDAGPTQVAEILLGGLLERVTAPRGARSLGGFGGPLGTGSGQPVYDFRPGVRELLFSGLGTQQSLAVVEAVGRALEPYMGRLPDFPALVADDTGEMRLQESAQAFAVLASPVLERLGGRVPDAPGGRSGRSWPAGPTSPRGRTTGFRAPPAHPPPWTRLSRRPRRRPPWKLRPRPSAAGRPKSLSKSPPARSRSPPSSPPRTRREPGPSPPCPSRNCASRCASPCSGRSGCGAATSGSTSPPAWTGPCSRPSCCATKASPPRPNCSTRSGAVTRRAAPVRCWTTASRGCARPSARTSTSWSASVSAMPCARTPGPT
ncbi:protein kinase [Streptomyces chrestomyceticus JCM 4735]|uniref:Protein kinase n=1 Tax=Streptomyces chrestomyceticus JCM 4735 TaxID=1306181 RepID=A0A7U9PWV6_9ACTN|nr:protein kinase [Streptomyces chrestomyceticus JCM 4735]